MQVMSAYHQKRGEMFVIGENDAPLGSAPKVQMCCCRHARHQLLRGSMRPQAVPCMVFVGQRSHRAKKLNSIPAGAKTLIRVRRGIASSRHAPAAPGIRKSVASTTISRQKTITNHVAVSPNPKSGPLGPACSTRIARKKSSIRVLVTRGCPLACTRHIKWTPRRALNGKGTRVRPASGTDSVDLIAVALKPRDHVAGHPLQCVDRLNIPESLGFRS
jgi:hypothetical protein